MLVVNVTEKNIKGGIRGSNQNCPIALSIKQMKDYKNQDRTIKVNNDAVFLNGFHYCLPSEASEFISKFDACDVVKPFSFEISLDNSNIWNG